MTYTYTELWLIVCSPNVLIASLPTQGSQYWQWDEMSYTDLSVYPKPLSQIITGVPSNPDAAFTWTNGKIYFFKGDQYWRVNSQLRVDRGYPLNMRERWMQCSK